MTSTPSSSGKFGHLFYKTPFSHYRLRIEYRFVGDQCPGGPSWAFRNSGVMIHGQPPESMRKDQEFPVSIEVQFLGGNGRDKRPTANVCTPGTNIVMGGKLITQHCTDSKAKTYHGDQWVTVEVGGPRQRRHQAHRQRRDGPRIREGPARRSRRRRAPADQERREDAQRRQHLAPGREPPDRVPQGGDPAAQGVTRNMAERYRLWPRVTLTQLLISIAILALPMALYATELRGIPKGRTNLALLVGSLAAHCVELEVFFWLILAPGIRRVVTRWRVPQPVRDTEDPVVPQGCMPRLLFFFGPCYAVIVPLGGWGFGHRGGYFGAILGLAFALLLLPSLALIPVGLLGMIVQLIKRPRYSSRPIASFVLLLLTLPCNLSFWTAFNVGWSQLESEIGLPRLGRECVSIFESPEVQRTGEVPEELLQTSAMRSTPSEPR